jgi:hypothetical protein
VGDDEVDTQLTLLNSSGEQIAHNDDGGGVGYYSLLTYTFPSAPDAMKGVALGITESMETASMLIYPNPTDGKFFVELDIALDGDATFEVVDAGGRLVMQQIVPANTIFKQEIDLSSQPGGVYFIRIVDRSGYKIDKLIIH